MSSYDNVISIFLDLITEYGFIDYTYEQLKDELSLKVRMVIAKARVLKDLTFIEDNYEFSRELTDQECLLIAYGLVEFWVSPKVNNVELFKAQMSSKDFTQFSNANRLNSLMELRTDARIEFNSIVVDYDYDTCDLFGDKS